MGCERMVCILERMDACEAIQHSTNSLGPIYGEDLHEKDCEDIHW